MITNHYDVIISHMSHAVLEDVSPSHAQEISFSIEIIVVHISLLGVIDNSPCTFVF